MDNPGYQPLGPLTISAPGQQVTNWVCGLEGVKAVSVQIALAYGAAGATVQVYLQTTLDQGDTAIDIACFTFTTASATKARNLSGLTPQTVDVTPTDGALADDTSKDGILGDRFRLKVISTGTYTGPTVLSGSLIAR
jgi:hypothetical protein